MNDDVKDQPVPEEAPQSVSVDAPPAVAEAPRAPPDAALPPVALPGPFEPPPPSAATPRKPFFRTVRDWLWGYFLGEDPTLSTALVPMCFLSMALFTRNPVKTNFIFDEQEALLANPYVRSVADPTSKIHWLDAFRRDFWGLLPDRTIGSYRPLPDLVWRVLWGLGAREQTPFLHHWVNVLLHGLNGALMVLIVMRLTKQRSTAWLAGAVFTTAAVLTEAVSGVVGLADVLGTLGAMLALLSLGLSLPWMPLAVFGATLIGLYSKESALCVVPLIPFAALAISHITHPKRPLRFVRMLLALVATMGAFVLYVEARRRLFPTVTPAELLPEADVGKGALTRFFHTLLRWYAQPGLPKDPLNNPLVNATPDFRIAGALRVYLRGLGQVVFPWTLSGDYSSPQEPIPARLVFPESILGGLAIVVPPLAAFVLMGHGIVKDWRARRAGNELGSSSSFIGPVSAVALIWIVVSYFPVSNIPIVLPTVRAERFWYFPVIGSSVLLAFAFQRLFDWTKARGIRPVAITLFTLFILFQSFSARRHANDYSDDLTFWDATRHAVPNSAKAHLNYSVMQGARGNLEERRVANMRALELAPEWPMASIYLGDTLCRLHRSAEAWPHYKRGFELGPNDVNLIALALQCLWDEQAFDSVKEELGVLGPKYPGSWLNFLQDDMAQHGAEHNGVDPKYRPRGYNEGPKGD
ncbi:MAG TPA: tetratricopeptide repeat protein [Polyangiaceae bacterium]